MIIDSERKFYTLCALFLISLILIVTLGVDYSKEEEKRWSTEEEYELSKSEEELLQSSKDKIEVPMLSGVDKPVSRTPPSKYEWTPERTKTFDDFFKFFWLRNGTANTKYREKHVALQKRAWKLAWEHPWRRTPYGPLPITLTKEEQESIFWSRKTYGYGMSSVDANRTIWLKFEELGAPKGPRGTNWHGKKIAYILEYKKK